MCVLFLWFYFAKTFELFSWFILAEAVCVISYPYAVEVDYLLSFRKTTPTELSV